MAYTGSQATAGRGSTLSIGSGTPVTIGEIKSSSLTGTAWGTVDVTNFESGADQEFITTVRSNGEIAISGNRVASDAGQVAVEAAYASGAKTAFKLQLPLGPNQTTTGDAYTFNAFVVSRDFDVEVTKEIGWSVKLKVSGPVTLVPGS